MKLTRVIAAGIMLISLGSGAVSAQTLRKSSPPAEFPPTSYKGKQYIDSRGCIYIRAGIDGNITWIPRVSRSRKQVCGYQPTAVAGAAPVGPSVVPFVNPPKTARAPVIITATPSPKATPTPVAPKPRQSATTKPAAQQQTTVKARPAPVKVTAQPKAQAAATNTPYKPSPGPKPTVFGSPRTVAASAPKVAPKSTPNLTQPTIARVSPDTRVVPRHVYENRQNTTNVAVPAGYKTVWDDGRLNPRRAERTLRAARVQGVVNVPAGYKTVNWDDDRLNLRRGYRTAQGDAQTSRIWTNTTPRTLVAVPTQPRIVSIPAGSAPVQDPQTVVTRLSTRSAQIAAPTDGRRIYVQVAIYAADADAQATARAAAQSLARTGLPMHLGLIKSSGKNVVLAGPFTTRVQAKAALKQVRNAGFARARLSK
jgi:hypothetical protein